MSFSQDVKNELAQIIPEARHCQIAEIAAFIRSTSATGTGTVADFADTFTTGTGTVADFADTFTRGTGTVVNLSAKSATITPPTPLPICRTDNPKTISLVFTLLQRAYNIETVVAREEGRPHHGNDQMLIELTDPARAESLLKAVNHDTVLRLECCKRAFLRGAFLMDGSVSNPEKSYHLEIATPSAAYASLLRDTMVSLRLDAKIVTRKKEHVVYLKEGDQIVQLLGMMGANISFLNIESVRVMKEMRSNVNRRVNCETANLNKTIVSAVRQIEDIQYIRDTRGFGTLSPQLRQVAEMRLLHTDFSLTEIGRLLTPPIGKSGVNHRLRKLSAIAAQMRLEAGDTETDEMGEKVDMPSGS